MPQLTRTPSDIEEALAGGWTIPVSSYSDPQVYEHELEAVFNGRWHLAGRSSRLSRPGDRLLCRAGRVPVLVVRDEHDELRGFVNVCRHRGHPVALEDGNRSVLQCRYHGWTYGLDGCLRGAPRCRREAGFDMSELSLLPIAVDAWRDFVFVNADPDAAPLSAAVPELDDVLTARGFDERPGFRFHGRWTYEIAGNWKAWTENAIECYHCPLVHRDSFNDQYETDDDVYEVVNRGLLMGQFTRYRRRPDRAPVDGEPRPGPGPDFRFCLIYPSSMLFQDDFVFFHGSTVPTGPESCVFVSDAYVSSELGETELEEWLAGWNRTLEEDRDVVAAQQDGLRSGTLGHGRLLPVSESAIGHFHRLLVADWADGG